MYVSISRTTYVVYVSIYRTTLCTYPFLGLRRVHTIICRTALCTYSFLELRCVVGIRTLFRSLGNGKLKNLSERFLGFGSNVRTSMLLVSRICFWGEVKLLYHRLDGIAAGF